MDAKFYIEHETEEYIYIIDTGIEEKKVREDAKNIVAYLNKNHNLGCRRVIYRNRHGQDNEIKHFKGGFTCCGLGHRGIELPEESEKLCECMKKLNELRDNELDELKP